MKPFALLVLLMAFAEAMAAPGQQGTATIHTSTNTLGKFCGFLCILVLVGRVMGWW